MGLLDALAAISGQNSGANADAINALGRLGFLHDQAGLDAVRGGHMAGADTMAGLGGYLTNGIGSAVRANVDAQRRNMDNAANFEWQKKLAEQKQANFEKMFKALIGDPDEAQRSNMYFNQNTGMYEGGGAPSPLIQMLSRSMGAMPTGVAPMGGMQFGNGMSGGMQMPMIPIGGSSQTTVTQGGSTPMPYNNGIPQIPPRYF